jgi:lactate dehydrogenase-like 2-hydroxyacid dehydrogenase
MSRSGRTDCALRCARPTWLLSTITDRLDAGLFAGGVGARLLGQFGVGYNNIDIAAARRARVTVTNTPRVLTDATADPAILLMLMVARRAGGSSAPGAGPGGGPLTCWEPR